jgi:hypothetical protein
MTEESRHSRAEKNLSAKCEQPASEKREQRPQIEDVQGTLSAATNIEYDD